MDHDPNQISVEMEADAPESPETPDATTTPADALSTARQEAAHWREMALRTAAELDNYRKRMAREMQEMMKSANSALLESLLPIMDNFEFGLQAARAENESSSIYQGMSMVRKQMEDFLRDHGVEEVPAVGQPFDPKVHEAMAEKPTDEAPEGTIISQARRGYKLRDRLLRAASVVVAKKPDRS